MEVTGGCFCKCFPGAYLDEIQIISSTKHQVISQLRHSCQDRRKFSHTGARAFHRVIFALEQQVSSSHEPCSSWSPFTNVPSFPYLQMDADIQRETYETFGNSTFCGSAFLFFSIINHAPDDFPAQIYPLCFEDRESKGGEPEILIQYTLTFQCFKS